MNEKKDFGIRIERGEIVEVRDVPERSYKIKSFERDGLITPWITSILPIVPYHAAYESEKEWREEYIPKPNVYSDATHIDRCKDYLVYRIAYQKGEKVFFFLFDDGTGKILSRVE